MSTATLQPYFNSNPEFRGDIQGLRAIAVLGVILFHANRDWLPGGFVGVDVFFVISGFLIADMILQKRAAGQFSFLDFYLGRARRIAPAYFVMLAMATLFAAILFTPKDFDIYWQSLKSAMYFGSNNYFSTFGDYFAPSSHELPLLHTWSLAVEMQFYILLPAMLVILPKRLLKLVILAVFIALFVFGIVLVTNGDKKWAYFSLAVRVPEFLVGVLLCLFMRCQAYGKSLGGRRLLNDGVAILGLLMIFGGFVFINEDLNFPGMLIFFPCIGAAFVIAGHGGSMANILSTAPMVWLGGLSYSLYLWHWPVFSFVRYVTQKYEMAPLVIAGSLAFVMVISYSSLRWVETPFRLRNWIVGKSAARTVLLMFGVCVPIISAQSVNAKIEKPLSIEYTRYADPSKICHGKIVDKCLRGSSRASDVTPVLVLGDSHAAQLNLFFDRIGERTGKKYRVITASSCVTIPKFDLNRLPEWARAPCLNQIVNAQRFMPESNEIIVAAMWQYQLQSKEFIIALNEFLAKASASKKEVIILSQTPILTANFQRVRRFGVLGIPNEMHVDDGWDAANKQVAEIVSQFPNVTYIDLSGDKIFSDPPFYRNTLIFSDKDHLNEVGSVYYAEVAIESNKIH